MNFDDNKSYFGTIIEESLADKSVLKKVHILSTRIEEATEHHKTPWLKKWTLHKVEIPEKDAAAIAGEISHAIDSSHKGSWYADYKTETDHYIIFKNKVFHVTDRTSKEQYDKVVKYGVSLGIPKYQVDFSPYISKWKR